MNIADLRAESLRLSRELRSPRLTTEQASGKREQLDRVNRLLTQALAKEEEKNREQERRDQARRDSWLERGESRRLRR